MNLAAAGYEKEAAQTNYVAVGQNGNCQVYKLTMAREKGRQIDLCYILEAYNFFVQYWFYGCRLHKLEVTRFWVHPLSNL